MAIVGRTNASKPAVKSIAASAPSAPKSNGAGPVSLKESRMTVTKTFLQNGTMKGEPVDTEEQIEVKVFATNPANVGTSVQYTRNLGNFESVKIGVDMHMPCYVEEIDDACAQVLDKVKGALETALETLQIGPSEAPAEEAETEAEEGTAESTETQAEESGDIDIDYLKAADQTMLAQIATDNKLCDPADYAELEDLRQTLIQAILGEEVFQAYLAEQGGGEEAAGEETSQETYTAEELQKATLEELKGLFADWGMENFPKGPPPIAKKAAIKKILEAQAG